MGIVLVLQAFIANFSIVTAFLFLAYQVIYRHYHLDARQTRTPKISIGLLTGLLGCVLMIFTVPLFGTILDFRQIAIVLAALFGGMPSALMAGVIIFGVRLLAFGAVSPPTVIAAANTIVIAIGVSLIFSLKLSNRHKWAGSLLVCVVLTGAVFFINLGWSGLKPLLIYAFMMSMGGFITARLARFLEQAKDQHERMEKEAHIDFLTGLHNHRTFDSTFNALLQRARDKQECLSIAVVDIDHFKRVNDTYGHLNGDAVLKQLGEVLLDSARSFDTVFRNGGEEFSILLYDTPKQHAVTIAERVRRAVESHPFLLNDGMPLSLTVSIGVATFPDSDQDLLFEHADQALYMAKRSGRNKVCAHGMER